MLAISRCSSPYDHLPSNITKIESSEIYPAMNFIEYLEERAKKYSNELPTDSSLQENHVILFLALLTYSL